ncbi:MAG: DUF2182 domain-containing protein [Chloroflexi bacterium]|nr:DUF2182 domain-containing protein [Chloroflexota bacterium]
MSALVQRAFQRQRAVAALIAALVALAWLVLWVWGQSPYGRLLSHHSLNELRGGGVLLLVFLTGWALMTVAMMLPTSLPLVLMFGAMVRRRPDRTRLVLLLLAGYLGIWLLFGLAVYVSDWALHVALAQYPWLDAHARLLGAATLVLAGLYQFTPLKYHCLDRCRSPLSFIVEHWGRRNEARQAFRLGVAHGLFCLGCCWSLMLLMFTVGLGNLGWMLALGAVMAVEKNAAWGRQLSAPLGALLVFAGLLLLYVGAV